MNWKGIGWASAAALVAIGCTGEKTAGSTPAKVSETKEIKIAMIAKSTDNPVFLASRTGAEAAAKDLSKDGLTVKIDWLTPPTESGEEQAKRIAQAVNDKATAILISCSDAAKVTGAINDADAKGVPVMTFDSDAPDSKRFAFYGADDEEGSAELMDELAKLMGNKGNVAILAGNQNAPNLQRRAQAVIARVKEKYPEIHVVDTFYHVESPDDASAAVRKAMAANPQITGWAMVGGWPLFARSLLDLDPKKVKIVAWDALPAQLDYVDKGVAPVLLAQPVYDWGYKSVGFIVDHFNGKPVETINKMQLVRVSKENLGEWANKLKEWGFEDVDPKYLAMKSNKPPAVTPGDVK